MWNEMKKISLGFSHFLDVIGLDIPRESFCHTEGTIEDLGSKRLNLWKLGEKSSMAPSVMISTLCRLIYLSTLPSVRRKLSSWVSRSITTRHGTPVVKENEDKRECSGEWIDEKLELFRN